LKPPLLHQPHFSRRQQKLRAALWAKPVVEENSGVAVSPCYPSLN
jgi:hypothetical protein